MARIHGKQPSFLEKVIKIAFLAFIAYVFSIILRVSLAEQQYFGRSDLIPLSMTPYKYKNKHLSKKSFQGGAYIFNRDGKDIVVWRQKINGFQHVYGPALMAYELGDKASDLTFCGNEYMEAFFDLIFDKHGITQSDILDRRKDLFHNALGRKIAADVKAKRSSGSSTYQVLTQEILSEVETGSRFIPHYNDPKVKTLKTEAQMGCPGLPPQFSLYGTFN